MDLLSLSSLLIWRAAVVLESLILFRGFRGKLLAKYPFFYTYIFGVFISDSAFSVVYMLHLTAYEKWYWVSTVLMTILGYGIILEVFNHVFSDYPGAEKFARITGLIIFGVIFCFAIIIYLWVPVQTNAAVPANIQRDLWIAQALLQRDFWTVQAIFIFATFGMVSYYKIPLGKNMKGMMVGYGLCLSVTLVTLTLRSYIGLPFDTAWVFLQPFSFDTSLFIWVTTLWALHPNPIAYPATHLEADYEVFAARTRGTIGAMRTYLGKGTRS